MEMEINVINNERGKLTMKEDKKFHNVSFSSKRKPHERIDLLITTSVNIYQTKKSNSNENMLF